MWARTVQRPERIPATAGRCGEIFPVASWRLPLLEPPDPQHLVGPFAPGGKIDGKVQHPEDEQGDDGLAGVYRPNNVAPEVAVHATLLHLLMFLRKNWSASAKTKRNKLAPRARPDQRTVSDSSMTMKQKTTIARMITSRVTIRVDVIEPPSTLYYITHIMQKSSQKTLYNIRFFRIKYSVLATAYFSLDEYHRLNKA